MGIGGRLLDPVVKLGTAVRRRWFNTHVSPALYEGSALDDFLNGQPLNIALRAIRSIGIRRPANRVGATVVIVNFNTGELVKETLSIIELTSKTSVEVLVLDNGSTDGSWNWLRNRPNGIRAFRIPVNIGHGRALDLGFLLARTPVVITLDSDAFPISTDWLDTVQDALGDPSIKAVGAWGRRDRLHPAFAAYRRSEVLASGASFHNYKPHLNTGEAPRFGENCFDTGEHLFERLGRENVTLLPVHRSENGWGDVIAGIVYHHRAVTAYDVVDVAERNELRNERRLQWKAELRRYYPDVV